MLLALIFTFTSTTLVYAMLVSQNLNVNDYRIIIGVPTYFSQLLPQLLSDKVLVISILIVCSFHSLLCVIVACQIVTTRAEHGAG